MFRVWGVEARHRDTQELLTYSERKLGFQKARVAVPSVKTGAQEITLGLRLQEYFNKRLPGLHRPEPGQPRCILRAPKAALISTIVASYS